jgi:acyl carrier protein
VSEPATRAEQEAELARLIVETLKLDMPASEIEPEAPLFGDDGLGLDSIYVLEIALAISQIYGVQLRPDDQNNTEIFKSPRSMNNNVKRQGTP